MALQTSGSISLLNIANEFGGSTPHSLSEYYGADSGIPSSGTISIGDFYGASDVFVPQTMAGVSGTTNPAYYKEYGYAVANVYAAGDPSSSIGTLTNTNSTPGGDTVQGVSRVSNPGFVGLQIHTSSSTDAGWNTCTVTRGSLSVTFSRVNCNYAADNLGARWMVGGSYGGSGTSWSGTAPVDMITGNGQSFTVSFT